MPLQNFEGREYGYTYDTETGYFLLYGKTDKIPLILKDDDAFMFREHLELINIMRDGTLNERTERVIQIHIGFNTKHCPVPRFIET